MPIQMIVTDLDGTLLNAKREISEANRAALRAAADRGVLVTIATGRMFCSAQPYAASLGVDAPLISYNGAMISKLDGTRIADASLAPSTVARVLDFAFARGWYIQLYANDHLYFAARTKEAIAYERAARIEGEAVGESGMLARTEGVPKLLLIADDPAHTRDYIDALSAAFRGEVVVMQSSPTYIEVVDPFVSKALAMEAIADVYGIQKDEILAIGDSGNDVPMVRTAGLGVAMGNAGTLLKTVAAAVTTDVASDGLAAAVTRYVLDDDAERNIARDKLAHLAAVACGAYCKDETEARP